VMILICPSAKLPWRIINHKVGGREWRGEFGLAQCYRAVAGPDRRCRIGLGWGGGEMQCNSCRIYNFPVAGSSQERTQSIYLNVLLSKQYQTTVL
jgi:hypothetical protein